MVTPESGTRHTIRLGAIPRPGERARLVGADDACASGCRLAAVAFTAYSGVSIHNGVDLGDLRGRRATGRLAVLDGRLEHDR